ncbi:MAG: RidA family protein [Pseudomonadales bacterium]|jgi:reactive intermediate/imine deaminase|nr:RidA family protein [Pseudomonadales bacterium]MDP6469427.1 RidA family protein [Pseudomonadales bacterium]MDP6827269.1 RidA family protein [Pseudomonadales bacterium]MDP6971092.1 RidA family protein [Pseudomonadales bacterium]|tara:strand:- start:522 stop:911 length:390 start_codon:yes stop_codon:yes gene_type:complete
MTRSIIATDTAPRAIGTYSQAVRSGDTIYLSGQIPLNPETMELAGPEFADQARQAFRNLMSVVEAAGGSSDDIVKLTVYLTDLTDFPVVNEIMAEFVSEPYPARAALGVAQLPRDAAIEIEGILVMGNT